ncbi:hypothetical protein CANARDRAFT_26001 [[Candida] arabinofermentans NRRL YB-2248]|uniref:Myb-like domain-containing protein n=1 Tax=[Candida] arabinofermentans NRRL YB-2248 TaxID=983967 RepID=A0A1E4T7R0_9ASCO|nr:hypothetical protein CANARDRAFT_26001 [[Candida] arabinofermentans NRRL YB-2248]
MSDEEPKESTPALERFMRSKRLASSYSQSQSQSQSSQTNASEDSSDMKTRATPSRKYNSLVDKSALKLSNAKKSSGFKLTKPTDDMSKENDGGLLSHLSKDVELYQKRVQLKKKLESEIGSTTSTTTLRTPDDSEQPEKLNEAEPDALSNRSKRSAEEQLQKESSQQEQELELEQEHEPDQQLVQQPSKSPAQDSETNDYPTEYLNPLLKRRDEKVDKSKDPNRDRSVKTSKNSNRDVPVRNKNRKKNVEWTKAEDDAIVYYKEEMFYSWKSIEEVLHHRHTWQAIQMRYLRNYKSRNEEWSRYMEVKLVNAVRKDWENRWKRISADLSSTEGLITPDRCLFKNVELCKTIDEENVAKIFETKEITQGYHISHNDIKDSDSHKKLMLVYMGLDSISYESDEEGGGGGVGTSNSNGSSNSAAQVTEHEDEQVENVEDVEEKDAGV